VPSSATNVIAISVGAWHTLALRSDGIIVGWGEGDSGELSTPIGLTNVVAISAGTYESLAIAVPLSISSLGVTGSTSAIGFHTFFGRKYSIEHTRNLTPANWQPVTAGTVDGSGGQMTVVDSSPR